MPEPSCEFRVSPAVVLTLWVAALALLLVGLGNPVVRRTQEARVVETAREMLVSGDAWQWMVPRLNGEVRLQKPPLAYWASAASFKVLGDTDFAGRFPAALAGWLTLAVVYRLGRGLVDQRFGLFSAAILLSSYMFFRHTRLAETDALATLFVTAAVHALWRGARATETGRWAAWFQWAGVTTGLALGCKFGPGAFPLVFLVAWALIERRWRAVGRFVLSGAPLTVLVVGLGWVAYLIRFMGADVFRREISRITDGENHYAPFYEYAPQMLAGVAPWTGLFVLGLVWAILHWRSQPAARMVLTWAGSTVIPLCLMGNKRSHDLMPAMPALAMLAAYAVHRGLGVIAEERRAAAWVFGGTIAVTLLGGPVAIAWAARQTRGHLANLDVTVIVLVLAATVGAVSLARRNGLAAGVLGYAAGVAMALAVTVGRWLPSLEPVNHRTIAAEMRAEFGDGPYVFYGSNESLPLVWNLRTLVPPVETAEKLAGVLRQEPRTIVIAQSKNRLEPPELPPELVERQQFASHEAVFRVYALRRK